MLFVAGELVEVAGAAGSLLVAPCVVCDMAVGLAERHVEIRTFRGVSYVAHAGCRGRAERLLESNRI